MSGTTNRIPSAGYSYDSNGNLTAAPGLTMSYDVENRMVQATSASGTEWYAYDPMNRRTEKGASGSPYGVKYLYDVDGSLLGTYQRSTGPFRGDSWAVNVYFAGRQVWQAWTSGNPYARGTSPDRLGSNVKHFPFGDEPTSTTQNRVKFATYYRDEVTALDYARNRYYSSTIARFTTADPYGPSARAGAPQSWNRYSYVGGDPVNRNDPSGLYADCDWWDWGCPAELLPDMFLPGGGGGGGNPCGWALFDGFMPLPTPACISAYMMSAPNNDPLGDIRPFLDGLQGAVLGYGWAVDFGALGEVTLSPAAYDYLADNGLLVSGYMAASDVARLTMVGCATPGGQYVCAVAGAVLTYQAVMALWDWYVHSKKGKDPGPSLPRPKAGVPTGTKPIDQMGWSHDQVEGVKEAAGAGPRDWVGVAPNGDVITGDISGNAVNHGPWNTLWP